MDKKRLQAFFNLGVQFNIHLLKKMLFIKSDGFEVFKKNYENDLFFKLKDFDKKLFFELKKCVNCGFCSSQCEKIEIITPQSIVISLSRTFYDFFAFFDLMENCFDCENCKINCPRGVPIKELIEDSKKLYVKDFFPDRFKKFLKET